MLPFKASYVCLLLGLWLSVQTFSQQTQLILDRAIRGTTATAVVMDIKTGRTLAAVRLSEAMPSTPGSVLKPFFLMEALHSGLIRPETTMMCRRTLQIGGHNVDCTHPQSEMVFNAELALAYSCNSYFAEMAKRFTPEEAMRALNEFGVTERFALSSTASTEQTQLFILGLNGIAITPSQLASAYRKLADRLQASPQGSPTRAVEQGLEGSVMYGMAHNAHVTGLSIEGKTGTASNPGQPWTHGWFAGFAPAKSPKIVVVIYMSRGNGADAAHLAQSFFNSYKGALLP